MRAFPNGSAALSIRSRDRPALDNPAPMVFRSRTGTGAGPTMRITFLAILAALALAPPAQAQPAQPAHPPVARSKLEAPCSVAPTVRLSSSACQSPI